MELLPNHIKLYIKTFLYPCIINETFDARIYPIKKQLAYTDLAKEALARRRTSLYNSPFIAYSRMKIQLPASNLEAFNLVCELDIIDTLIFNPDVDYFYIDSYKVYTTNGEYRPTFRTADRAEVQWFFASFQSWMSKVEIRPRPIAIIGGFINSRKRTYFQMTDGNIQYEYEQYGACLISSRA